jgi:hypothetical protein
MEGVVCDVAADFPEHGFVFTPSEILTGAPYGDLSARAIRRVNHLRAAHKAESTNRTWPVRHAT